MALTYICDLVSTLVFTVEMVAKIKIKKLFHGDNAYIFDRWCQFDGTMVVFHIISVVLQVRKYCNYKKSEQNTRNGKNRLILLL